MLIGKHDRHGSLLPLLPFPCSHSPWKIARDKRVFYFQIYANARREKRVKLQPAGRRSRGEAITVSSFLRRASSNRSFINIEREQFPGQWWKKNGRARRRAARIPPHIDRTAGLNLKPCPLGKSSRRDKLFMTIRGPYETVARATFYANSPPTSSSLPDPFFPSFTRLETLVRHLRYFRVNYLLLLLLFVRSISSLLFASSPRVHSRHGFSSKPSDCHTPPTRNFI